LAPASPGENTPRLVHTLKAIEDAEILEVSTPQLDDVVRLEDRYGRVTGAEEL
jgi:mannose-6-phosphate isomerase